MAGSTTHVRWNGCQVAAATLWTLNFVGRFCFRPEHRLACTCAQMTFRAPLEWLHLLGLLLLEECSVLQGLIWGARRVELLLHVHMQSVLTLQSSFSTLRMLRFWLSIFQN